MSSFSILFGIVLLPFVMSVETLSPPSNPPRVQIFTQSSNGVLEETIQKEVTNNTVSVIFTKDLQAIELHCSSYYPIKWEFIYKGIPLPVVDVIYKRIFNPVTATNSSSYLSVEDLTVEANNEFLGILKFTNHLQSQNGRYVCSHYNSKLLNNSHGIAASVDLFIPGNMTFYEVSHVQFINSSKVSSIIIPCTVTDPSVHVKLYRLNDHVYKLRKQFSWKRIEGGRYNPMKGFELQGGLGRTLLGDYSCSSGNSHVNISFVDLSEKTSLETEYGVKKPCWEDARIMKMLRSKRLECFCRDSFALFSTDDEESNRKGNCPSGVPSLGNETEGGLQLFEKCKPDWRALEFLATEESKDEKVCYRDRIRENLNGSGTRFFLRVKRRKTVDGKLNLTVHYDGAPTYADGFKLAVKSANGTRLLTNEPTRTQKYPLAHFTATWENLIVENDVEFVSVFQPLPHAYEWFGLANNVMHGGEIEADGDEDTFHSTSMSSEGCNKMSRNIFLFSSLMASALASLMVR